MIFAAAGEWVPPQQVHAEIDPQVEQAWRTTWMTAVRDCEHPGLLVDLPSKHVLQVSGGAVERFGLNLDDAATVDDLVASAGGPAVLDLLADGAMETVHGRRGYRLQDEQPVEVWCWARAVHSPSGEVMALMGLEIATTVGSKSPAVLSVPFAGVA